MVTKTRVVIFTLGCFLALAATSGSSNYLSKIQLNIDSLIRSNQLLLSIKHASAPDDFSIIESCRMKPELQEIRSKELITLLEADQADREGGWDNISNERWIQILEKDLSRRKRVGEILAEGCFKTPDDYKAASMIYQHGDVPDHYFQAFIWAKRAVELDEKRPKNLVALTIDRYLVSIGKKQLFGSQFFAPQLGACYCLEPVEDSFPDSIRKEYTDVTLQDRLDWLPLINEGKDCPNTQCLMELQPSPKGTVPGFW
jgi:hypothetical protein